MGKVTKAMNLERGNPQPTSWYIVNRHSSTQQSEFNTRKDKPSRASDSLSRSSASRTYKVRLNVGFFPSRRGWMAGGRRVKSVMTGEPSEASRVLEV